MERLMKRIKMKRLTKRINGVVTYIGKETSYDTGQIAAELNAAACREILERLADYEDTERRPEEVQALNRLFDYALTESRTLQEQLALIERLRELAEADKDGRLAVLPCKDWLDIVFGEQVLFWGIDGNRVVEISVDDADRITWYNGWKSVTIKGFDEYGNAWEFDARDIDKTVFLTREEAEKTLEGER